MISNNKTRFNTLYWEIKTRFSYIFFSFFTCFTISYKNSIALLYLFVSSYEKDLAIDAANNSNPPALTLPAKTVINNSQNIKNFCLCDTGSTALHPPDLSIINDKDLIALLDTLNCSGASSIKFIFTDIEEAFSSTISICFIFSFVSCFLYIVYVAFAFLAPSMYRYETKKWLCRTVPFVFFWIVFIAYLQNVIIPKLAHFLLKFQIQSVGFNVQAETKIYSYCVWASTIFLIANLIFFFVFIVIFAIINRNIQIDFLILHRKWCGVFLLLISALIAPPEIFAQLFLVIVFFFFFELLIYFFLIYKKIKQPYDKNS